MVITGLGVVAPNGNDLASFWESVRTGKSGVAPTTRYDVSKLPVKVSAEVRNFSLSDYIEDVKLSRKELAVQYGLAAALMAVKDSALDVAEMDPDRIGFIEGTTTSGASNVLKVQETRSRAARFILTTQWRLLREGSSTIGIPAGRLARDMHSPAAQDALRGVMRWAMHGNPCATTIRISLLPVAPMPFSRRSTLVLPPPRDERVAVRARRSHASFRLEPRRFRTR